MILSRLSEKTGVFGGLTADGMMNVLGRPALDGLTLVLREAAQNSWDARESRNAKDEREVPRLLVRIRTLSRDQESAFRILFSFRGTDEEPASTNELARQLASERPIRVLEICDFATVGLRGPVDPREPLDNRSNNFCNFFFDIGVAHPDSGDGGTYGYGRSSLYGASSARTILVDTLARDASGPSRRLMACRIGHAYERRSFVGGGARYTGRHFWGERQNDFIVPISDEAASAVASGLGLPHRSAEQAGTSIVIPWPDPPSDPITGQWIAEVLVCNLWPKMVSQTGPRAMRFEVEDEGRQVPIPRVLTHPVYGAFCAALLAARTRKPENGVREICLRRPSIVAGHLALEVSSESTNRADAGTDEDREVVGFRSPLEGGSRHVALMRPSELIVRYLEVPNARNDGRAWAGVFICADVPDVQRAFAQAEPPAHDDWIADRLEDRDERRMVYRTVSHLIPNTVKDAFSVAATAAGESGLPTSLAAAADRFSRQFFAGDGTASAQVLASPEAAIGTRRAKLRGPRVSGPWFESLRMDELRGAARYRLEVSGTEGPPVRVRASASVVAVGGDLAETLPAGMAAPVVNGWYDVRGEWINGGDVVEVSHDCELLFDVVFGGEYAISASCEVVPG